MQKIFELLIKVLEKLRAEYSFAPDHSPELKYRLFRLISLTISLLVIFVLIPANLLQNLPLIVNVPLVMLGFVCFALYRAAVRGMYTEYPMLVVLLVTVNSTWFLNGGIDGSVSFFFLSICMYPILFFRGWKRWITVGGIVANCSLLMVFSYRFPQFVIPYKSSFDRVSDQITGVTISSLAVILVLWVVLKTYQREKERLEILNLKLEVEIADRQRIQQELERRNLILSTEQETSLDGIIVIDENNTIVSHNQRFIEMWDIPPELVEAGEDEPVWKVLANRTADPEGFAAKIKYLHVRMGEKSHEEVVLKDNRAFEHYSSPMISTSGTYFGKIWYFRDITDRKKMQEEIIKAQKLESMGVLAGGIAHDFNNILTGIMGNFSLARMLVEPGSKIASMLEKAEKASLRAKELAQQLLTFSRGGAPVKKSTYIGQLVIDSATFSLRGSNVTARFFIPEDLWPVDVDSGQMSQVINNLVINAVQAMPDGGIITVTARNVEITPEMSLSLPIGSYVKISLQDDGVGISEANMSRIFDPYFTTKTSGSGLGLSMVYSIIRKHGGNITVDSQPGVGTVFHFYLAASDISPQPFEKKESQPPQGKGKILVMDDEEIIREIAGEILSHLGYEVESCIDGAEAIRMYEEALRAGEPYAAVLMDLTIPGGMGGKEAVGRIMEVDHRAKVIVSSGYSNDPIMAQYKKYSFRGVVLKPYSAEELGQTLGEVIATP
ncbi:MAG TPA: ATP-binding protein [Geobacteraceae bacterium]|nr:ATP-binding protein [Geobacteraceae bacterium]